MTLYFGEATFGTPRRRNQEPEYVVTQIPEKLPVATFGKPLRRSEPAPETGSPSETVEFSMERVTRLMVRRKDNSDDRAR